MENESEILKKCKSKLISDIEGLNGNYKTWAIKYLHDNLNRSNKKLSKNWINL